MVQKLNIFPAQGFTITGKALFILGPLGFFNQEKALVGAFSVIVKLREGSFPTLVVNVVMSGCDCDDTLPNSSDFCPANSECKQCKCLPAGDHSSSQCAQTLDRGVTQY